MPARPDSEKGSRTEPGGITALSVSGFKSIYDECSLEIRPLTILAGANSSGKSSAIQPLLLLKQTAEAISEPPAFRLEGDHVHFTSADQFFSRAIPGRPERPLCIGVELARNQSLFLRFERQEGKGLTLPRMEWRYGGNCVTLAEGMTLDALPPQQKASALEALGSLDGARITVSRDRCFLEMKVEQPGGTRSYSLAPFTAFADRIRSLIHVSALRATAQRTQERTDTTGPYFRGPFHPYAPSFVAEWDEGADPRLAALSRAMSDLGLTCRVGARRIADSRVEIRVARLPRSTGEDSGDSVNIADVGIGVSEVLPVVVALLVAEPGQLVYIDEPELHLHPRALMPLAELLAKAASRGVRVIVETHSSPLLLAIQTLVAEGSFAPERLRLHWFQRSEDGATTATKGELDEAGAFGDWPEDFGEVELKAESRYLDAAELARGMQP